MTFERREHLTKIWGPNLLLCPEVKAEADRATAAFEAKTLADAATGAEVLRARGIDPGFTTLEHAAAIKQLEAVTEEPVLSNDEWLAAARAKCAQVELELRASSWHPAAAEATADGYSDETNVRTRSI
jgi:hypothetical protein